MTPKFNPGALKAGDALPPLKSEPVSPVTLALFAGGSGDHNPIHLDPEFARRNGFPDVFAHGMLSMAYLGRLLSGWAPVDKILDWGVRFAAITPLRAQAECRATVREIGEENGRPVVRLDVSAVLPDGTATLLGDATVALD